MKSSTTLGDTTYDIGGTPGHLRKRKAYFIVANRLYIQLARILLLMNEWSFICIHFVVVCHQVWGPRSL